MLYFIKQFKLLTFLPCCAKGANTYLIGKRRYYLVDSVSSKINIELQFKF